MNNIKTDNNNLLSFIDNGVKTIETSLNNIKNKTDIIQGIIEACLKLFNDKNDKGGFLRACFKWDNTLKQWKEKTKIALDIVNYINNNGGFIHFDVVKQKLRIDLTDFNNVSYKEYKQQLTEKRKKLNQDNKDYIKSIKIDTKIFNNKNKDYLQAVIFYCQDLIKDLNNKKV